VAALRTCFGLEAGAAPYTGAFYEPFGGGSLAIRGDSGLSIFDCRGCLSADEHGVHPSLSERTCDSSQSVTRNRSGRPDHWPRPRPSCYLNPPRIFLAKPSRR